MEICPCVVVLWIGQEGVVDVFDLWDGVFGGNVRHEQEAVVPIISSFGAKGDYELGQSSPDLVALQVDPRELVHQLELLVQVLLERKQCLQAEAPAV